VTFNLEQIARNLLHVEVKGRDCNAFVNRVFDMLGNENGGTAVRYTEFINDMYRASPVSITRKDVLTLSEHPTAFYVLSSELMEAEEDTVGILFFEKGFYNIIDVKTRNLNKNAQPPNIISAYKLAQTCALMIENEEYDTIGIDYIGVDWREDKEKGKLVCEDAQHANLFLTTPSELYINWAAGLQIQFHPHNVDQTWQGSQEQWAREYLRHFVGSAQRRCETMREKFVVPFLKYLD